MLQERLKKKWLRRIRRSLKTWELDPIFWETKEQLERFAKLMVDMELSAVVFIDKWDKFYLVHKGKWKKFEADKDLIINCHALDALIHK